MLETDKNTLVHTKNIRLVEVFNNTKSDVER